MYLLHPAVDLGRSFTLHTSTVIGLTALAALYLWRAKRGPSALDLQPALPLPPRARGDALTGTPAADADADGPSLAQRAAFFHAIALIFFTLNGPLHDLSDYYLFSAHMVQHLILTLVVPPLLLYGTPGWMLRPLLRVPLLGRLARSLTSTASAFLWFNAVLAVWHLPPMYNAALEHHAVHIVQHLMFISTSVLMWWPLASRVAELPRLAFPGQMLFCFLMVIPMSVVSIYIVMADALLYPAYAIAPRIWGISPLADQQYGGLIMWIPGGVFFYAVMTVVFFKWSNRDAEDSPEDVGGAGALAPVQAAPMAGAAVAVAGD
jgi:putative membrane protein